jgi:hypothetical protein
MRATLLCCRAVYVPQLASSCRALLALTLEAVCCLTLEPCCICTQLPYTSRYHIQAYIWMRFPACPLAAVTGVLRNPCMQFCVSCWLFREFGSIRIHGEQSWTGVVCYHAWHPSVLLLMQPSEWRWRR